MGLLRRTPKLSVVVPAYGVERWIEEALASLVGQTFTDWEAVVVDDGSVDASGEIAAAWAARDRRIRVERIANRGLGGARNHGVGLAAARYLTFLDPDDVLPPDAYAALVGSLEASGSDLVTGSIVRWEDGRLTEPPWMRRAHGAARGLGIEERPEILGDVFAWNKVWRRSFWDRAGLSWPERVRYEDQPTVTRSFLAARFDVLPDIVYRWRIRSDGTSITQQRDTLADLSDRLTTKRMSLQAVTEHGSPAVTDEFVRRVLAGDMWRYFLAVPDADDAWWQLLRDGVREFWGEGSLVDSDLPPVHRLAGWLVGHDRRRDLEALLAWTRSLAGRPPRESDPRTGGLRLAIPADVLDVATVDPAAVAVRPAEA